MTLIFGRSASASATAKAGVTTGDILKAASWNSESVFQRFYHKSIDKAAYGRAVINQNSSEQATNTTVDIETEPSEIQFTEWLKPHSG